MGAPPLNKTGEMLTVKYPWSPTYQLHAGCCYSMWCWPCAAAEISEWHLNQKIEKRYSLMGQTVSCIATLFFPVSVCICPRDIHCCYWTDLAEHVGLKMGKDMTTFGPCGEWECFGAYCAFYWPCTDPCTRSMMFGDIVMSMRAGEGGSSVDSMFAKMGQAKMLRN